MTLMSPVRVAPLRYPADRRELPGWKRPVTPSAIRHVPRTATPPIRMALCMVPSVGRLLGARSTSPPLLCQLLRRHLDGFHDPVERDLRALVRLLHRLCGRPFEEAEAGFVLREERGA